MYLFATSPLWTRSVFDRSPESQPTNNPTDVKRPIVKLVIKDLIKGDGAKEELSLSISKINLLEQKVILKDSVIKNLNFQIGNFESIMLTKSDQLSLSQELSKRLQNDLKKQKLKTKLMGGAGIAAIIGTIFLLK